MATGKKQFMRRLRLAKHKNKGIPASKIVIPDGFEKYRETGLPAKFLTKTSIGGELWIECAIYFENMVEAARAEGITLIALTSYL